MKGKLNILMVLSEVAPFLRTGDVGELGAGLPKALKDLGHDVRVITPQYRGINERKYILRDVIRLQDIEVPLGNKKIQINVKSAFLPNSKVQVYFLDYKPFFFRQGIYSDTKTGKPFSDNDQRFILFSKGVLKTLTKLQWQPDVIHCHNWQTSLIPFFLSRVKKDDPFFAKTNSLLTIHDFSEQGVFDSSCVKLMDLEETNESEVNNLNFNGKCIFLKTGIVYSNGINTISERYAQDLLGDPKSIKDLQPVLKTKRNRLPSVPYGIDDTVWNPETDSLLNEKYNMRDFEGKTGNKKSVLENYEMGSKDNWPLIAMIATFTENKGVDLVKDALEELLKLDILFILFCKPSSSYQKYFESAQKKYKHRFAVDFSLNDASMHRLFAGADMVLVPSKHESGGFNQLIALQYGSVPIVRETGGLADRVHPFNASTGKGNGFVFKDLKAKPLLKAVKEAVKKYNDPKIWKKIVKNGMREDLSWRNPAKKYIQLYSKCASKK